jgi:16S rRNA (cytosine1402-N4)-methyltransferase
MIALIDGEYMSGETESPGGRFHIPVLLRETISALEPAAGKIILDGTVGGGGHALALLEAGASVIACDQDPEALEEAGKRLAGYPGQVRFIESNFADVGDRLPEFGVKELDGVLLDLGVSSHQIDTPSRGFSFLGNGPLDKRQGSHVQRAGGGSCAGRVPAGPQPLI